MRYLYCLNIYMFILYIHSILQTKYVLIIKSIELI